MAETLRIPNSSHELVLEVVRTLPISPVYSNIVFFAHGVRFPENKFDKTTYLAECKERGIIPFSRINYTAEKDGSFLVNRDEVAEIPIDY